MVDINVDQMIYSIIAKKKWRKVTKELIKYHGFYEMLDIFLDVAADNNEKYYIKNPGIPKHFFKGDLKITDIADEFGLKPIGKKLRICPFHTDTNPSLSLSNEKGLFNCFGCHKKGNLITFYAELKKLKRVKDGNKK